MHQGQNTPEHAQPLKTCIAGFMLDIRPASKPAANLNIPDAGLQGKYFVDHHAGLKSSLCLHSNMLMQNPLQLCMI